MSKKISSGTVHNVPRDMRDAVAMSTAAHETWEDVTPLARNEWICWITSAKKSDTRAHRIKRACVELAHGKRRPCCWAGCPHRENNHAA